MGDPGRDRDGRVNYGLTQADSYEGEFERLSDGPLNVYDGADIEDPFMWYDSGYHFLLTKKRGEYLGYLAASPRGLEWSPTTDPVYRTSFTWSNGEEVTVNRRERPSLLFENGTPTYLYTAIEVTDPYDTYSVAAPVDRLGPARTAALRGFKCPGAYGRVW